MANEATWWCIDDFELLTEFSILIALDKRINIYIYISFD